MDASTTAPSARLALANERLYQLRDEVRAQRVAAQQDVPPEALPCSAVGSPLLTASLSAEAVNGLPVHLGWESAPVTAVLRRHWSLGRPTEAESAHPSGLKQPATTVECATCPAGLQAPTDEDKTGAAVKLYPSIGLAMLRQGREASGRLWLLLRHLDKKGRGALRIDTTTNTLTTKNTKLYLCGKRQLRNLLRDGEGLYWTRDKDHIWLRSTVRVAFSLGVEQLTGWPVALPAAALLDGIGTFRAHLYAAFHSGRVKESRHGDRAMPIARDTLATLSGVGESSQRTYEARLRLRPQVNYAIGEAAEKEKEEERAWQQGQAFFGLKDYRGQQGKQGRSYLAWQLPNSYGGQHQQRPKGRQKRINRQLKDLVMKGMPGNDEAAVETQGPEKRYYPNGRSAGQARGPRVAEERYWRRASGPEGRVTLWHPLQGN
jgi:hypothetical protein